MSYRDYLNELLNEGSSIKSKILGIVKPILGEYDVKYKSYKYALLNGGFDEHVLYLKDDKTYLNDRQIQSTRKYQEVCKKLKDKLSGLFSNKVTVSVYNREGNPFIEIQGIPK
jgi:hypothetical protein